MLLSVLYILGRRLLHRPTPAKAVEQPINLKARWSTDVVDKPFALIDQESQILEPSQINGQSLRQIVDFFYPSRALIHKTNRAADGDGACNCTNDITSHVDS
jgi:hypothetical protein